MELTPTLLHEVEFRPEWRGYNRAEVDDFLERVATSVEQLLARLRDAERGVPGTSDESITRTLVLAQRTADAAIREAEEQAARTLSEAEQRAEDLVREAEDEARRAMDDTRQQLIEEVAQLEDRRGALTDDLGALEQHLDEQRSAVQRVVDALQRIVDDPGLRAEDGPELKASENLDLVDEDAARRAGGAPRRRRPLRATSGGSPAVHDAAAAAAQALGGRADEVEPADLEPPLFGDAEPAFMDEADDEGDGEDDLSPDAPLEIHADRVDAGADDIGDLDLSDEDGGPPTESVRVISLDEADELARRAAEHDPFLAELRKAVTDDEPLGPREEEVEAAPVAVFDQDYLDGREGFRARLRRRG